MKSLLTLLLLALPVGMANAAPQSRQLARPDGGTIHYTLDAPPGESAGLLVLAQGSDCRPAAGNANLAVIRAAFPAYTAVIVEKSGISPDSPVQHGNSDCPPEFRDTYTLSGRIADYQTVLAALDADPAKTILFGGSEGGLAMEALAARFHPAAAILLSGSVGETFGDMVLASVPPQGRAIVRAGFEAARADPHGSTLLSGHTHRFWADALDHRSSDYLEATDTPFLLIHARPARPFRRPGPLQPHLLGISRPRPRHDRPRRPVAPARDCPPGRRLGRAAPARLLTRHGLIPTGGRRSPPAKDRPCCPGSNSMKPMCPAATCSGSCSAAPNSPSCPAPPN
ncbi:hypothetical protein [Devosia elaeis]|uniref:Serine aminopeptidase S33 domain-containing protein n=1 Tax=Devosia elaeis TaxID=1770058 RepID=A0A178HQ80_9HYPH|nr:hypothetical protein [Devosia elaeis]OAM74174.1 hypothetical protein A3840_16510 [Devosia elaeis]